MKITLKPMLISLAALAVVACATQSVPLHTLRQASVAAGDQAPDVKTYVGKRPGQGQLIARSFDKQPPLVPHTMEGYDISPTENACWDCHNSTEFKGKKMPMVSNSHLVSSAPPALNMQRWQCNNCHVAQVDARPLVDNAY
ncbi:MAG: nitrate reductase cytochrome c-type subunit [Rhodoferax sp.]